MLSTDSEWATKAMVRLYRNQTQFEKMVGETYARNGIGFNAYDGKLLMAVYVHYKKCNYLLADHVELLHRRLPKYAEQLVSVSNKDILTPQVLHWLMVNRKPIQLKLKLRRVARSGA